MSADLISDLGGDKPPILVCRSYLGTQIAAAAQGERDRACPGERDGDWDERRDKIEK